MSLFGSTVTNSSPPYRQPASTTRSDSRIDLRRAHEDSVADRVAETVVDGLEAREIHHEDRHDAARALGARDLAVEVVVEEAAVVEARQRVGDRVHAQGGDLVVGQEARLLQRARACCGTRAEARSGAKRAPRARAPSSGTRAPRAPTAAARRSRDRHASPLHEEKAKQLRALDDPRSRRRVRARSAPREKPRARPRRASRKTLAREIFFARHLVQAWRRAEAAPSEAALLFARESFRRACDVLDGLIHREDEHELATVEEIHELAVGPGPQDVSLRDEKARTGDVGPRRVEAPKRLHDATQFLEAEPCGAQPARDAEAHDVAERIPALRAVTFGARERRREEPEPIPVVELPRGKPRQPRDLRSRERSLEDPAVEFHSCILEL